MTHKCWKPLSSLAMYFVYFFVILYRLMVKFCHQDLVEILIGC